MTIAGQHLLVIALVTICVVIVAWQGVRALVGKRSKLGSCCAKGCSPAPTQPYAAVKIHFLPVEMLRKKRG